MAERARAMPGIRYRTDAAECRRSEALGGMTLIYHRPSGATHVVAEPAPQLLEALGEGPADADELLARLARRHDLWVDDGKPEAIVAARLEELEAAGLVFRA